MNGAALIFNPDDPLPNVVGSTNWRDFNLAFLQKAVGGYIEAIPYFNDINVAGEVVPCVAYCNEEGKLRNLSPNMSATSLWGLSLARQRRVPHDILLGPVVIIIGDAEFLHGHIHGDEDDEP